MCFCCFISPAALRRRRGRDDAEEGGRMNGLSLFLRHIAFLAQKEMLSLMTDPRMRVQLVTGGWVGLWRPIVRTVLLCLVIPAVIWDADQRGLHRTGSTDPRDQPSSPAQSAVYS